MNLFVICLIIAISGFVKSEKEKFDDESEDNSVFDKILMINQKAAARSRSGGPRLVQGDIVETPLVKAMMAGGRGRGAATGNPDHIWPIVNGKHVIPYQIDPNLGNYKSNIYGAMREWMEKVPCLKFVQRTNQNGYLYLWPGSGCSSAVGRQGGMQRVSLARGCLHHGIIVHELGHALGFWHEQSRQDRDNYVTIYWNNINPSMKYNFEKMSKTNERGVGYDYESIMHYGPNAFSRNGRATMVAKNGASIGQRQGLSNADVQQARRMYTACSSTGGGTTGGGTTGGGTTGGGTTGGSCADKNSYCGQWAGRGHCKNSEYASYMAQNCKKSCCKDYNGRCQEWAGRGECNKNPRYMIPNCKKSCNRCGC